MKFFLAVINYSVAIILIFKIILLTDKTYLNNQYTYKFFSFIIIIYYYLFKNL